MNYLYAKLVSVENVNVPVSDFQLSHVILTCSVVARFNVSAYLSCHKTSTCTID